VAVSFAALATPATVAASAGLHSTTSMSPSLSSGSAREAWWRFNLETDSETPDAVLAWWRFNVLPGPWSSPAPTTWWPFDDSGLTDTVRVI
jgi:hypothetical protein